MTTAETERHREIEPHIALCVRIAGLGFGPDVMRLALERRGVAPAAARLIALSVANSHSALREIEAGALGRPIAGRNTAQSRQSNVAGYFLGKMLTFIWFGLIAVGGGLALGWMVGFEYGLSDGYDQLQRSVERLLWR